MIVVIDYGMGNLGSIVNMLKKIGVGAIISSESSVVERAYKLILPGVGAFDHGMRKLDELGLIPTLNAKVLQERTPVLGICLGAQLLTKRSQEGNLPGLGWLDAESVRFSFDSAPAQLKVPHMGWNEINITQAHPLFEEMDDKPRFYFVHSYHLACHDDRDILAKTYYGYGFASVVGRDNILGTQFHPEKSHKFGMKLLKNFVEHI